MNKQIAQFITACLHVRKVQPCYCGAPLDSLEVCATDGFLPLLLRHAQLTVQGIGHEKWLAGIKLVDEPKAMTGERAVFPKTTNTPVYPLLALIHDAICTAQEHSPTGVVELEKLEERNNAPQRNAPVHGQALYSPS
jgi:hypothetical protein